MNIKSLSVKNKVTCFLFALLCSVFTMPASANATPTITTQAWPGVPSINAQLYSHGNQALTTFRNDASCGATSDSNSTPNIVTRIPSDTTNYTTNNDSSGWKVLSCDKRRDVGADGTVYFVQQNSSTGIQRVVAKNKNATLWTRDFSSGPCNYPTTVQDFSLGYDGNIYMTVKYESCSAPNVTLKLVSLDAGNGTIRFQPTLPSPTSLVNVGMAGHEVLPYSNGIAVANNDSQVYYYTYAGAQETSKTFTPSVASGSRIVTTAISPSGRVYLAINTPTVRKIFYKDTASSTISEITPSYGGDYVTNMYAAPNNQVVLRWYKNSEHNFSRYDSSNTELFSRNLQYDNGASLATPQPWIAVSSTGDVIAVRTMSYSGERLVYVDSFSPTNVQTRLMNSNTEFGASTTDKFSTGEFASDSIGDGTINLVLCHTTGYSPYANCQTSENPKIVTITDPSNFSYNRSALYSAVRLVDSDTDSLTLAQEIAQGTSNYKKDTDDDGLSDYEESTSNIIREDLFCNATTTYCEYPSPTQKDIYIETDWMYKPASGSNPAYSMRLTTSQLNAIKNSYLDKGILAHIDSGQLDGGAEVPYDEFVYFNPNSTSSDFYDYKYSGNGISAQFDPLRYHVYHYMLLGDQYSESPGSSGAAHPGDDDTFIAYGIIRDATSPLVFDAAIVGTVIHELGHNLCLTSGSTAVYPTQPTACRFTGIDSYAGENYPSVMNYSKQMIMSSYSHGLGGSTDHDDWGSIRLQDFAGQDTGDTSHGLNLVYKNAKIKHRKPINKIQTTPVYEKDVRSIPKKSLAQ